MSFHLVGLTPVLITRGVVSTATIARCLTASQSRNARCTIRGQQSAIVIWPPGTPGSGLFNETFSTDIPLTTSPATLTQPNALLPLPVTGSFIRFCPDTDCYVRFAATAALCGAATVNDWFWGAGIVVDHWCEPGRHDWFAVIAKTTIGKFKRYRTNEY